MDPEPRKRHRLAAPLAAAAGTIVLVLAGCGSGGGGSTSTAASAPAAPTGKAKTAPAGTGAQKPSCGSSTSTPATSEAAATSQGDIPDNQQFLTFANRPAGYSLSYPEGWARSGNGSQVRFQDKANTIVVSVQPGSRPTPASVAAELKREAASDPCLAAGQPQALAVGPNKVVKVTYTTKGPMSPVTGQRPKITVDRYVYFRNGKVAVVDLGTPVGVDNVDAYRMISQSFRWS